jgi:hypothetical protein
MTYSCKNGLFIRILSADSVRLQSKRLGLRRRPQTSELSTSAISSLTILSSFSLLSPHTRPQNDPNIHHVTKHLQRHTGHTCHHQSQSAAQPF